MTQTTLQQRTAGALVAAALAVAAVLGPGTHLVTRLGASEQVVAADAVRGGGIFAEVAAGRRTSVSDSD